MANTKKAQQEAHDPEVAIQTAIGKTEHFIQSNSKTLFTILMVIVGVACLFFGWKYLVAQPKAAKAADAMFVAEQFFGMDEYQQALEGDGNNAGFLEIIDRYGSTPQGNLARQYAGICYLNMDKPDEALAVLSKYKTTKGAPNQIVNAQNFGLRGDILVQKEQYKEALEMYQKAVAASSNPLTAPYYLKKAGLVCEKLGDNAMALTLYQRIGDEFPGSMEGRDNDRNIGRVQQQ